MKTFVMRVMWYAALAVIAFGFSMLPSQNALNALIPALLAYVPASIFWLLFRSAVTGKRTLPATTFCVRTALLVKIMLVAGCALAVLLVTIENTLAASFAVAIALCGADGLLQLRSEETQTANAR
jgi:hypothetical protein